MANDAHPDLHRSDRADDFASVRVPLAERRGHSSIFMILFGIVTAFFFLATGGSYFTAYGAWATWLGLAIGFVVLVLLAVVVSRAASSEGLTAELITRACGFGYAGTILTSLIYAVTFIFYTAIEGQILADAAAHLIPLPPIVWYIIAGLIFIPLLWKGTTQLTWLMWLTIPVYVILITVAIVRALGLNGGFPTQIFTAEAPGGMAAGIALSGVLAGLAGTIGLNPIEAADYNRYIHPDKFRRSFWISLVLPYALMFFFAMPLGMFFAAATGDSNPASMFAALLGPLLAVLLAWISQIRINLTNIHLGSIALTSVSNRVRHSEHARKIWTTVICIAAIPLMAIDIVQYILPFLAFNGVFLLAWVGCVVSDLLIVRRLLGIVPRELVFERERVRSINPVGPTALVTAVVIGSVLLFAPGLGPVSSFAAYIGFGVAVVVQAVMARATNGKYYVKGA
ncbi:hypothetical protein J4H92_07205 [Leucobacter weissii]|uniref:Permease n=1 Tax=Leucobacter weissii TaxID=1983706 RepID=A0A939MIU8_9MICO|nr:hypothetical protein [Leucobacter weissii]MBO1901739.1 hypothetical protein [Leucobacter weissii]